MRAATIARYRAPLTFCHYYAVDAPLDIITPVSTHCLALITFFFFFSLRCCHTPPAPLLYAISLLSPRRHFRYAEGYAAAMLLPPFRFALSPPDITLIRFMMLLAAYFIFFA